MSMSNYNISSDLGVNYDYSLGVLNKEKTKFISSSSDGYMLAIYLAMMFYFIGGLNVLKLKYLYPCLEDLCAIYADVLTEPNLETSLLPEEHNLPVLHVRRPVLLPALLDVHGSRGLRPAHLLLLGHLHVHSDIWTHHVHNARVYDERMHVLPRRVIVDLHRSCPHCVRRDTKPKCGDC